MTEISGAFSSTKTTEAIHIMRNAIYRNSFNVLFQDVEGTSGKENGEPDEKYFNALGIDVNDFIYSRPDSLEECTQMILNAQQSGQVQMAIWDSLAMTEPNKILDKDMEDTVQMGVKQRLDNEFFSKYQLNNNRLVREGKIPFTLVVINQLREKIGAIHQDPEYTPGGRGKSFASSVEIRFRQGDWIKEKDKIVGQVVKYKINKNKTYMRMKSGEFDIYLDENNLGVPKFYTDNEKSLVIEAVQYGLIEKRGGWYYVDNEKFQGLDKVLSYLREHPKVVDKFREQILDLDKKVK
jgi:recombination protein RecA